MLKLKANKKSLGGYSHGLRIERAKNSWAKGRQQKQLKVDYSNESIAVQPKGIK